MMSVFVVVMSICSGAEGCLEERQATAYSTRAECVESVATMLPRKGIKYHCSSVPQFMVGEQRRETKPHFVTTSFDKPVKP
jgi:hypothetical protein